MLTRSRTKTLVALGALALAIATAPSASADTVSPYGFSGETITGAGTTAGEFNYLEFIAFDDQNQNLYTLEQGHEHSVSRFNPDGSPAPFSGLSGASSIELGERPGGFFGFPESAAITVDNSAGSQGSFYATLQGTTTLRGFDRNGAVRSGFPAPAPEIVCGAATDPDGDTWVAVPTRSKLLEFDDHGVRTGAELSTTLINGGCVIGIDSHGDFYLGLGSENEVAKVSQKGGRQYVLDTKGLRTTGIAVDRSSDEVFLVATRYQQGTKILRYTSDSPEPIEEIGLPDTAHGLPEGLGSANGIAVDSVNHALYVTKINSVKVFARHAPVTVPGVKAGEAVPTPTTATLKGTVDPDGITTDTCHFEWGTALENESYVYEHDVPCAEGSAIGGSDPVTVSAQITGLTKDWTYHFRLVASNSNGFVRRSDDQTLIAQDLPAIGDEHVTDVRSDGAMAHALIDPEGGLAKVQVEIGTDTGYGTVQPVQAVTMSVGDKPQAVEIKITGLLPDTAYHYRVVAMNAAGKTISSSDHQFRTHPLVDLSDDKCENALSRQQTGAALLADCRAYELVSAANTGGYNVESDLIPGQQPFSGYPLTDGRALYGVHDGGIPGTGNPTNHGVDPYLATRGAGGWTTRYIGIPADGAPLSAPFASTLLSADQSLETFAFGGPEICAPCFPDGSTGIPLRTPAGDLVQGMAGSQSLGSPLTDEGLIAKPLSDDGSHLLFGSLKAFEGDGNDQTGDLSIYDRDLVTGQTQVVSKTPAGTNLPCLQGAGACHPPANTDGIAELDISADGSRIIVAQRVSIDSAGNRYWHPYMHVGNTPETVDLAPGTTTGALFDGMTADGTRVFLTTRDALLPGDTDASADIYEARVNGAAPATMRLVTTKNSGGPSNSDSCQPVVDWNTVVEAANCDAVAFAGGGGVGDDGTFYFLSPELLDAGGIAGQVNLYVVRPDATPRFVGTIDSGVGKEGPQIHPVRDPEFAKNLKTPETLEVDQATGDVYVKERATLTIARFTSDGTPHNFTAGPGAGTNRIAGESLGGQSEGQIAVDGHAGSPFENTLYATSEGSVSVFAESGQKIGKLTGFSYACGVAVDQSSGVLYVGDYENAIWRLAPITNPGTGVTSSNYSVTQIHPQMNLCQVAADTSGHVYASAYPSGPVKSYPAASFAPEPGPSIAGTVVSPTAQLFSVDPSSNDLYVNTGSRIDIFDGSGAFKETMIEDGIESSSGVAVNGKTHVGYVTRGNNILELPFEVISNPAVMHAVRQSGVREMNDIQVTPDGSFAAFSSAMPLTGYESGNHLEIFRYDPGPGKVSCVSCLLTNARASTNASLARHGLSLTPDGRVFFNTGDPLVLGDTNSVEDAYEWNAGVPTLISTGTSKFNSGLLSASADGRDVYFFTRDVLSPEDHNGTLMKLYDAREKGGYFKIAEEPPCAASDECHGPGTKSAPPPTNASKTGTPGNFKATKTKRCKKGQVKRAGKCVKRNKGRKRKRHHARRSG